MNNLEDELSENESLQHESSENKKPLTKIKLK